MCFTGYLAAACIFFLIIDILVFQKGKEKKNLLPFAWITGILFAGIALWHISGSHFTCKKPMSLHDDFINIRKAHRLCCNAGTVGFRFEMWEQNMPCAHTIGCTG
jgi:hypothetical protein